MSMKKYNFGKSDSGREIELIEITNSNNLKLQLTNMGATWVSMFVPDRNGNFLDVVLGLKSGEYYENHNWDAMGAIIGRNANRISNHSFVLNGIKYDLADNCRGLNIHSGPDFFGKRFWDYEYVEENNCRKVIFSLHSPDMDQGMPGNMDIQLTYTLTDSNEVIIDYDAVSDKDTVFNMTNHSYFNLNGHNSGDVLNHIMMVNSDKILYSDNEDVMDTRIHEVENTPFDFRKPARIGDKINEDFEPLKLCGGYDHNYLIKGDNEKAISLLSNESGIGLDIFTDRPGVQIYTGNYMNNKFSGKAGAVYLPKSGVAFETQHYPNAVNRSDFPSPFIKANEKAHTRTIFKFYEV